MRVAVLLFPTTATVSSPAGHKSGFVGFIFQKRRYVFSQFAPTSLICSRVCFDRDEQIRSETHSNPTQRLTLAGRSRMDQVETVPHAIQVPSWNGIAIAFRTVHPSRTDRGTTPAALYCPRSTRRSTNKTLVLRQASLRVCWTVCMELANFMKILFDFDHQFKKR